MKDPLGVSPSNGNQGTNIHMYPYFLFAAIHHLIVPDFLSDLVAQSAE